MCVAPGSQIFWIGLALITGLTALFGFSLYRTWRSARHARTAHEWLEALGGNAPALLVHGLWMMVAFIAAQSCGVF